MAKGNCKPTMGYPTRTAACLALRERGLDYRAIADTLEIDVNNVKVLLHKARAGGVRYDIYLPPAVAADLAEEALVREVHAEALAARILTAVLADDLTGAVLDDDPDTEHLRGVRP